MRRNLRALLFLSLLPGSGSSVEVVVVPKVALPLGGPILPRYAAPVAGNAFKISLSPAIGLTPALVAPRIPDSPGNSAQKLIASLTEEEPNDERDASAGASIFDRAALRTDTLDAVSGPGISGGVSATGRGVRLALEPGHSARLVVMDEKRKDEFIFWKEAAGYRIRRQGSLRSRAVPEKGFFIYRGPAPEKEGADRYTIVDGAFQVERVWAALSVEAGVLVVQDLGSMTMRDNSSVLISGARAEGTFPIQRVLTPAGHAFERGAIRYRDETVAVEWDKDPALRGFYDRVKTRLGGAKAGELEALASVFESVAREVRYDEAGVSGRIASLDGRRGALLGELLGLSEEKECPAVGVCRHMALLLGAVLERLIQEGHSGLRGGKVFYVDGKGHAWSVYRDSGGGYHVLDAAQRGRPVPLEAGTSYTGEELSGKGTFSYADDMTPELKRDWRSGLPSGWNLSKALGGVVARLRDLMPDRSRKALIRRRLAEIRERGEKR